MDRREENKKDLGFYRARLNDSDVLYDIIDREVFPSGIHEVIQRLKIPEIYVFISSENNAILVYEPVFGDIPWCNCHTWTKKSCRGKKLKEFFWKTGIWMVHNTKYMTFTSIITPDLKRQGLFLSAIGAKRQFEDGSGNVCYTFDKAMFEEVKEKLGVTSDILRLYKG